MGHPADVGMSPESDENTKSARTAEETRIGKCSKME
jgi:hypothetical protein